jgi:hypothetical protein
MTFVEKHRLNVGPTEREWLKLSWEGKIFGVGMFEAMAEIQPERADEATACATMEWFDIHRHEVAKVTAESAGPRLADMSRSELQQTGSPPYRPERGWAVRRGRTRL